MKKGRKASQPSDTVYDVNEEELCQNPDCEHSPKKHRHFSKKCLQHLFCAQSPIEAIDGTQKDMDEKMAIVTPYDFQNKRKYYLYDKDGVY